MSKKSLFSLLYATSILSASDQVVLVVAEEMNATRAQLSTFERKGGRYLLQEPPFGVNLGRGGLGWDEGTQPLKYEGDGKAPAGMYPLLIVFGYAQEAQTAMPYIVADAQRICVDDANHSDYNRIVTLDPQHPPKSFEWMRRDDEQYRLGIVVDYNAKRAPMRGSCIFLHVQKAPFTPSAGCTTMEQKRLEALIGWLDPAKSPLLIQIPRSMCASIASRFEGVRCP